jgi:hypothetical protein
MPGRCDVSDASVDKLARDLVRLLQDQMALHGELAMLMRHKLDAIKQADSSRIQSITAREEVLADRATERDGLRRQITKRILGGLGRDAEEHRSIRLTELAELLGEPRRSQLLVVAAGLKEKAEEIDRARVATTLITQEMLKHLREVLAVMTDGGERADVYSRTGQRQQAVSANVFEAVG